MVTGSLMPVSLPHAGREDTAQGSECLGAAPLPAPPSAAAQPLLLCSSHGTRSPKGQRGHHALPQAESNGGQGGWGEEGAAPWASGRGCQGRTSRGGGHPRPDTVFSSGKRGAAAAGPPKEKVHLRSSTGGRALLPPGGPVSFPAG